MKAISQFVVHVFDLIEAEGRGLREVLRGEASQFRNAMTGLAFGLAFLVIAIPMLVIGGLLLAGAFMFFLNDHFGKPITFLLTGLLILAIGVGCLAVFKYLVDKDKPKELP